MTGRGRVKVRGQGSCPDQHGEKTRAVLWSATKDILPADVEYFCLLKKKIDKITNFCNGICCISDGNLAK